MSLDSAAKNSPSIQFYTKAKSTKLSSVNYAMSFFSNLQTNWIQLCLSSHDSSSLVMDFNQRFNFIMNALTPHTIGPVNDDHWMTLPGMGFLLAQRYKYTVVVLAGNRGYSEIYFPLEGAPTACERLMCLGWVNGNHFLVVLLKAGCPIPHTSSMWDRHCLAEAVKWPDKYIHRMSAYNTLKRAHRGIVVEDYVPRQKILVDLATEEDSIVPETVDLAED